MTDGAESAHGDLLTRFLANHDAECPVCGYNLRGLQTAVCPECSKRIELCVRAPDAVLRWYLVSLVAISIAFGFTGIVGAICAYFSITEGMPQGTEAVFIWTVWALAVVSGMATIGLSAFRSRFQRLSRRQQVFMAVTTAFASLAMSAGYSIIFVIYAMM